MVVLIVMGVCGCGKTTIAQELASKLQCSFKDADEFHTEENKGKMNSGIPLTDQDRTPWLCAIHYYIKSLIHTDQTGVITCSALKQSYRSILLMGSNGLLTTHINDEASQKPCHTDNILFVYLKGTKSVIQERLLKRTGHFMSPTLLDSQFQTLEEPYEPERYFTVNVDDSVDKIVKCILEHLSPCLFSGLS